MGLNQEERWLLLEKYEGQESDAFLADLESLRAGKPLAYLIGYVPFLDCRIHLDSRPLIPRPETEFWVEKAIEEIKKKGSVRVLDLCAGSGCIGVAVAKHCSGAHVTFAELDPIHLPTIKKNLVANLIDEDRYELIESDLFENVSSKFDFILSNPPYIDPVLNRTERSVKEFEPSLALYGGEDGLDVVKKIILESSKYLNPGGQLWVEHEPEQMEELQEIAEANEFEIYTNTDQYGVERYSILAFPKG